MDLQVSLSYSERVLVGLGVLLLILFVLLVLAGCCVLRELNKQGVNERGAKLKPSLKERQPDL